MKKIVIVGAGNASQALAADLALKGHHVKLLVDNNFWNEIEYVAKNKSIVLIENNLRQVVNIHCVTNNPNEAIPWADIIFIPVPAYGQDYYVEWIKNYLLDGQILLFVPGNFGSLTCKEILKTNKINKKIIVGETNETPFGSKVVKEGTVEINGRNEILLTSAFPYKDTNSLINNCKDLLPLVKAENIIHCALHGTNPCYHVPGCILNAGRIERSKGFFYLYEEGITPAVARMMQYFDDERIEILKATGSNYYTVTEEMAAGREPRSMWEEINGCKSFEFVRGPEDLESRYFREDIPYSLVAWCEIANILNVKTPLMNAFLEIGGKLLDVDLPTQGRNALKMGLSSFGKKELINYIK